MRFIEDHSSKEFESMTIIMAGRQAGMSGTGAYIAVHCLHLVSQTQGRERTTLGY